METSAILQYCRKNHISLTLVACEQALGGMEGKRKERGCMHTSDFTVTPLFSHFHNLCQIFGTQLRVSNRNDDKYHFS